MDDLQIEPQEVKRRLAAGEKPALVDVRETWEYALRRLEGAVLVPMGNCPDGCAGSRRRAKWWSTATTAFAASMPPPGCASRESDGRIRWPEGSIAGRGKSIRRVRVIEIRLRSGR